MTTPGQGGQPAEEPSVPETQPAEEAETSVGEEAGEEAPEKEEAAGGDVRILGKEGFEPDELKVSAGSSVTWINGIDKKLTLTFFKDSKFYQNSDVIEPGKRFELAFNEKGSYEYWSPSYGVKGKITVQ